MSEQLCKVVEDTAVQYDLSLVITASHNVSCCTQCRGLGGERVGERRREGGRRGGGKEEEEEGEEEEEEGGGGRGGG